MIDNDCIITSKRCNAVDTGPSLTLWKVVAAILATGFITIAVVTWMPNVPVRSIAVMPFENLSGAESDQYLVSGFKEELVQTLHNKLVGKCTQTLIKSLPTDSEAYDSYMRGIYALEHRDDPGNLEAAVELFQDAIVLDESYGPSYLGLATAYAIMVDYLGAPLDEMHRRAFETVEKGITFDPIIGGAAGAIYGYIYHKEKRWAKSEEAYLGAVNASIVDSNAFNWYSRMLASVGRLDAALVQAQRAVELDPSSGLLNSRVAIAYTWLGDAENAHEFFAAMSDPSMVPEALQALDAATPGFHAVTGASRRSGLLGRRGMCVG